jgi:hypothetical protein
MAKHIEVPGILVLLWRGLLLPALAVAALLLVLAALVEGPAMEQFIYAVF